MRLLIRSRYDNSTSSAEFDHRHYSVLVGSAPDRNHIVLESADVPDVAVEFLRQRDGWFVRRIAENDCRLDRSRLRRGEPTRISHGSTLEIPPFSLTIQDDVPERKRTDEPVHRLDEAMGDLIGRIHLDLLNRMDLDGDNVDRRGNAQYIMALEICIGEIAKGHDFESRQGETLVRHIAGVSLKNAICRRMTERQSQAGGDAPLAAVLLDDNEPWRQFHGQIPEYEADLERLVEILAGGLGVQFESGSGRENRNALDGDRVELDENLFWPLWADQCEELYHEFRAYLAMREIKKQLKDIVFGYGPLEDLLRTPTITEIMVVAKDKIYVERLGIIENSGRRFVSDKVTEAVVERIVAKVGRRINMSEPMVDARLADGSRVNAIFPPLAVSGPCLTIRKFPERRLTVDDLIRGGSLSASAAAFLMAAVKARRNIIISGGTGSGKTTLLNCLSEFVPDKERIVTIEDTAELQIHKRHVVRLETKLESLERKNAYDIGRLVRNALRMRPDRIVVGECRGSEALDMLQAMNTGHGGSLTTLHANSPADAVLRLEVLVANQLPVDSIRHQIASAIDLIVQIERVRECRGKGNRQVTSISEVLGMAPDCQSVRQKELFRREMRNGASVLVPTGYLPTFMDQLIEEKLLDLDAFY